MKKEYEHIDAEVYDRILNEHYETVEGNKLTDLK